MGTPYAALAKKSGVAIVRLFELSHGAAPTDAELAALASPWRLTAEGLRESIILSAKVEGSGQETELTGASEPEIGP